jgi:hypothetical protein
MYRRAGLPAHWVNDQGDLIQLAAPALSANAAKQENVMRSLIQDTPAYQLSIDIAPTPLGHSLRLISFVPTARRPEDHVKFQGNFAVHELEALQLAIQKALEVSAGKLTQ